MHRIATPILLAMILFLAITLDGGIAAGADDEYLGLPDDKGREEVFAYCGACHSMKLVVQQGLTREKWKELLVWMVEEQGMPELEPEEEKLILDYLAEHAGPDDHKERLKQRGVLP